MKTKLKTTDGKLWLSTGYDFRTRIESGRWVTPREWHRAVWQYGWGHGIVNQTRVVIGDGTSYLAGNRAGRAEYRRLVAEGKRRARAYARSK